MAAMINNKFMVDDLTCHIPLVRKAAGKGLVPAHWKKWHQMTTINQCKFVGVCYSLDNDTRKRIVLELGGVDGASLLGEKPVQEGDDLTNEDLLWGGETQPGCR